MNEYYKYEDPRGLSLTNKKGVSVHFMLGTVWEHAGQEKIIIHEEIENIKIKLSKKSFEELKKQSKQFINPQEDIFEINDNYRKESDLFDGINNYVNKYFSALEHTQIASNYKEIRKNLKAINEHIEFIHQNLPINFDEINKKLKFSLEFFSKEPVLYFPSRNNPSIEKPYSFVPEIEKNALSLISDGMKWVEDKSNIYMLKTCISDFLKVAKIAHLLNDGEVLMAEKKSHVNDFLSSKLPKNYIDEVMKADKNELRKMEKFAKEKIKYSESLKLKAPI